MNKKRQIAYEAAIRLANGDTINRKDMPEDIEYLTLQLKLIKNNCNNVLRQLKAFVN